MEPITLDMLCRLGQLFRDPPDPCDVPVTQQRGETHEQIAQLVALHDTLQGLCAELRLHINTLVRQDLEERAACLPQS